MNFDDANIYIKGLNLKFDQNGLLPAIIQDAESGKILMLAYMSLESLAITLTEGQTCFWSRSRHVIWRKGETSGHRQIVKAVSLDCDRDTLLVRVEQVGAACHNGTRTCFVESVEFENTILKNESGC